MTPARGSRAPGPHSPSGVRPPGIEWCRRTSSAARPNATTSSWARRWTSTRRRGCPCCSPKSGLPALAQSLATERGPQGVRVNSVAPGPMWTDEVREFVGRLAAAPVPGGLRYRVAVCCRGAVQHREPRLRRWWEFG
ncbi:SDR family oxidoreductase [Streptomyces sp. NPDC001793]|uniref:SDR family oxidoreductase n=1 Tax=Streptomyces sp. NPDC001793 TaxID=3154657 RepID=UPI0033322742